MLQQVGPTTMLWICYERAANVLRMCCERGGWEEKCGAAAVAASLMSLLLVYRHFGSRRRPIAFRLYKIQETSPTAKITGPGEHVGYLRDAVRAVYINTPNPTLVALFLLMNGFGGRVGGGWAAPPPAKSGSPIPSTGA